ncbi:ImmA/IrrE family metallo-endopeptidase [Cytophaga sp. FL35]|uniref:ImmA/IrrE family metallo-endopeptidase n=1 Tax=Cytophaga sp. FL35 TaxID=1904456 RepID=UPI001653BED3|nr:ImmA/IrrE family metallo-endopeptidase [Cytophaga sp. FL35]MBC6999272.1 ImmA/IrrE family metallo-endopeptidase [Cytophaga sp. FL35]
MQQRTNEFLTRDDVININELASSISDYYFPESHIDPSVIATKNQITFSYGNYDDSYDGLLEHFNGKFHIYINIDKLGHAYSKRSRFTFGHELGHYFIDSHRVALTSGKSPSHGSFTGFVSKNRAERQADYFSSCLLMPENRFKSFYYSKKFQFRIIEELASKFGTSLSATALRFCAIGNHPILVVCGFKGKVKWYWSSYDFRYKWLKYGKDKIPEDTVAGEYFELGRSPKTTEEVFAMDWFNIKSEEQAIEKFYEHARCVGDYTLSIIWEE